MSAFIIATAALVAALLAFTPKVRASRAWKATVTPLSSIMGSGFLVSAPLVAAAVGVWAPLAMGALLLVSFGIGAMIRFNIRYAETLLDGPEDDAEHRLHRGHRNRTRGTWGPDERHVARGVEKTSHVVLAGAYVVSVSYYLQLLSAFVFDQFGIHDATLSRVGTTSLLALITAVGSVWGLRALEKVETYAVSLNLATITALLLALALHVVGLAREGSLALPALAPDGDLVHASRVMMGLLIVVQGFETSRFLGSEHPREERIATMRTAQLISAGVYLAFVTLMLPLLGTDTSAEVTAIVQMVAPVASVLPVLIVVAAVGSQFSASVADDAGCAGLARTIFNDGPSSRWIYLGIGTLAIGLTWLTDVMSIISLASRAFALFYALQCAVTATTALGRRDVPHARAYVVAGVVFSLVALSVTLFGVPAE